MTTYIIEFKSKLSKSSEWTKDSEYTSLDEAYTQLALEENNASALIFRLLKVETTITVIE